MSSFRLYSRLDTFYGNTGQLLAGGQLRFFEAGTTDPLAVYGDADLAVNNGVTVDLDSSGRPDVDVWGEGAYFVEVYDALEVKQGEVDQVEIPGGDAAALPTGADGEVLSWLGGVMVARSIRECPDPTGQTGKALVSDGENWIAQPFPELPEIPEPDIVVGASSLQAGISSDPTKFLIQAKAGTAPAAADIRTSVTVTFDTAYAALLGVMVTPTIQNVSSSGGGATPVASVTGYTPGGPATSVTVNFRNPTDGDVIDSGDYISSPVTFVAVAFGTVEAA